MTEPATAKNEEAQQAWQNLWAKYEQLKADLPKDLSPEQYRAECKRIADELGI